MLIKEANVWIEDGGGLDLKKMCLEMKLIWKKEKKSNWEAIHNVRGDVRGEKASLLYVALAFIKFIEQI